MTADRSRPFPSDALTATYRIVLEGKLGDGARSWFEDADITATGSRTELVVVATDQAALHGVLRRIHDLHLKLVSVTRIDTQTRTANE